MRDSRLVSHLLLLQARGRMTAAQLAEALEVSVRTLYRDLEALSSAGVPVYAEAGPNGGCQLVDGYRTRLTGLTGKEAEALFAAGVPGPVGDLGLGTLLATAQLKVLAALPEDLAERASSARQRFHLDAPAWFRAHRQDPHLTEVAAAVWDDRCLSMRYRASPQREAVSRKVEPLGLVVKAGTWYLIARRDGHLRTYRVSRMQDVVVLDEGFERPQDFDLAAYWSAAVTEYEAGLSAVDVELRASPRALERLSRPKREVGRSMKSRAPADVAAADPGWERCVVAFEDLDEAYVDLVQLGADVEVLAPEALRARMAATAASMAAMYVDQ